MASALSKLESGAALSPASRPEPLDAWERKFVAQKRAVRASWSAIAAMLGRPEPDVRLAFDPEYRPVNAVYRRPLSEAELAEVEKPLKRYRRGPRATAAEQQAFADRVLAAMGDGSWTTLELVARIRVDMPLLRARLVTMRDDGLLASTAGDPPLRYFATLDGLRRGESFRRSAPGAHPRRWGKGERRTFVLQLLAAGPLTAAGLAEQLDCCNKRAATALGVLVKDGLVGRRFAEGGPRANGQRCQVYFLLNEAAA